MYRGALLFVIAICTYLHVPLVSDGRLLVPSFPTVVLIPLIFLTVRKNITLRDSLFLTKIAFVLLLSIAFSPGYKYLDEKFLALVQCLMALGVAVLIVRLMQQLKTSVLEHSLGAIWMVILIGCILEILDVTRNLSDEFREWAFATQYTLYDADLRDASLVGWPRPKLFSVEPSHVTKFFVATINAWLLVRISWAKATAAAGATLAMLVMMGSPMLLISAAISLSIVIWSSQASMRTRIAVIFAAIVMIVGFAAFFASSTLSTVTARVSTIGEESDSLTHRPSSEQQRVVVPYITLVDTWLTWPVFGVGIGAKEVVAEHTRMQLSRPEVALGNNAFAELGIYLGVVGIALFIYLFYWQSRQIGIRRVGMMFLILGLFSQLMGGVVSFQFWGFVALMWGALAVNDLEVAQVKASSL